MRTVLWAQRREQLTLRVRQGKEALLELVLKKVSRNNVLGQKQK